MVVVSIIVKFFSVFNFQDQKKNRHTSLFGLIHLIVLHYAILGTFLSESFFGFSIGPLLLTFNSYEKRISYLGI